MPTGWSDDYTFQCFVQHIWLYFTSDQIFKKVETLPLQCKQRSGIPFPLSVSCKTPLRQGVLQDSAETHIFPVTVSGYPLWLCVQFNHTSDKGKQHQADTICSSWSRKVKDEMELQGTMLEYKVNMVRQLDFFFTLYTCILWAVLDT